MADAKGIVINTVAFGEGGCEISYIETREQSEQVGMIRTMLYQYDESDQARVNDLLETLEEMVDEGLVRIRNPQFRTRRSASDRAREIGRQNTEMAEYDSEVDGKEYGD